MMIVCDIHGVSMSRRSRPGYRAHRHFRNPGTYTAITSNPPCWAVSLTPFAPASKMPCKRVDQRASELGSGRFRLDTKFEALKRSLWRADLHGESALSESSSAPALYSMFVNRSQEVPIPGRASQARMDGWRTEFTGKQLALARQGFATRGAGVRAARLIAHSSSRKAGWGLGGRRI